MFNATTIITVICLYIGVLFILATWVEKKAGTGQNLSNNAIIYSLSLAIYCTSWTYYGSVGKAASSGMLFLTIYLGPTLAFILWCKILRKLVRIKQSHRINSIADLIAARYNNSQFLAAIATLLALVGIAPYIALQFKAVIATFVLITATADSVHSSWVGANVGPIVVCLMVAFTIIFGVRRLDPTERHQGIVVAVAVESVIKLLSFIAAGIFVSFFLFDGLDDIFAQLAQSPIKESLAFKAEEATSFETWCTYLLLSMAAVMFLPRQFHISVVENSDEKHIRTAMWLFPLYLFLINIFVLPIAAGGLLKGLPLAAADTFVLGLPLQFGTPWLTLLVFIGGFSAATSMIMISSMTMATMITNHIYLPIVDMTTGLGFLRRHILRARWVAVTFVILLGYWFERKIGGSYTLVNMGMISFAAALQFAPPILGGILWRNGNRAGATLGLGAGLIVWFYTLLLPSFIKSGWLPSEILEIGFMGISFLKPEQLFGLTGLEPLTHGVFWTMFFNISLYTFGSLLFEESENEKRLTESFFGALTAGSTIKSHTTGESLVDLAEKTEKISKLLRMYFPKQNSTAILEKCLTEMGLTGAEKISIVASAEFCSKVERVLAGSIGTTAAHKAFSFARIFTHEESQTLSAKYAEILAGLQVTPEELKRKVDYHQEREALMTANANVLEEKVTELQEQIVERRKAEEALKAAEVRYRTLLEASPDAIIAYDNAGRVSFLNSAFEKTYGWPRDEILGKGLDGFVPKHERQKTADIIRRVMQGENVHVETQRFNSQGDLMYITMRASAIRDGEGNISGSIVIHRDVTEQKRMEETVIQSEKMLSVGGLAAGMAHEINNPLAGIMQNIQVVRNRVSRELPKNREVAGECGITIEGIEAYMDKRGLNSMIDTAVESCRRAATIVGNMLSFARKGELSPEAFNVADLLDKTVELARNDYDLKKKYDFRKIEIVRCYDNSIADIFCEGSKLQQVFLNILKNGAEAMIDKTWLEGETPRLTLRIKPVGEMIQIDIEDNGPGIPEDVRKRVFEPFYTTKGIGVGTGLGLSVSYFIITENHGGTMSVESPPGKGACFIIRLPEKKTASLNSYPPNHP